MLNEFRNTLPLRREAGERAGVRWRVFQKSPHPDPLPAWRGEGKFLNWKWLAILLCVFAFSNFAQQNHQHASDFSSVEYFPPPHERQIQWRISGAEAQPLTGGLLLIKKLKIEEFAESGKLTSVVEAPECLYDRLNLTANSAGPIKMRSGDGKFRVDGDGFLFHQTNSFLTISNNVKTVIEAAPVTTEKK